MEEINDNDVHGKTAPFVLTSYLKNFLLCPVTELALPVSHAILGHHWCAACHQCILGKNFCRCIRTCYEVIQFSSRLHVPFRTVCSESCSADSGIIPQKSIPAAGNEERNRCLTVSVCQFQVSPFFIQGRILILPHAENLLIVESFKPRSQMPCIGTGNGFHFASFQTKGDCVTVEMISCAPEFLRQQLTVLIVKGNPAFWRYHSLDISVLQMSFLASMMFRSVWRVKIPWIRHINLTDFHRNRCIRDWF